MTDDSKKVQLHIRIPIWLKDFLQKKADDSGTTMTDFLLQYLHKLWEEEQRHGFVGDLLTIKENKDE